MGNGKIQSPHDPHHLTDHQKFVTGDYDGNPYGFAKFGANPSMDSFWVNG